ncbi:MAG: FMN-binding protein [Lachnospiraceae bacterium]
MVGKDASDATVGYVISVSSGDGYDGTITLSVGLDTEGTVLGISFTELHETAGMGMLCGEDAFRSQFAGVNTDAFTLNKAGGSTTDNEIDSVSGASTSSGAVVNAVNTALAFYASSIQ